MCVCRCEGGSECVAVVNDLLQLPVAHCVPGQPGDGTSVCTIHLLAQFVVARFEFVFRWLQERLLVAPAERLVSVS